MDRRTIIIGVAILALIIIVWYFMFRRGGDSKDIIPNIIPGDVIQTQYPFNEPKIETYITEYASDDSLSDASLSNKIDFEVRWNNGNGFNNVKAMKIEHRVKADATSTTSTLIESKNLAISDFAVNKKQNLLAKFDGSGRNKSIIGINFFEILYTTEDPPAGGTTDNRTFNTLNTSGKIFSTVTITQKDLLVALELVNIATYIFTPVLSTLNTVEFITSVKGNFIALKNDQGIVLNGFFGMPNQGIFFIKGTADGTVQMTIGNDNTKNLIGINADGSIQQTVIPPNLKTTDDVRLIKNTIDGTVYYSILKNDSSDTFLVYQKGAFKFTDIKTINDDTEYNSIYLTFSESSDSVGLYCKTSVSCLISGKANCNGQEIGRGRKCIAYSVGKPTGTSGDGYTLCTDDEKGLIPASSTSGEVSTTCPVNCIWNSNKDFSTTCPPANVCKLPGDPERSVKGWTKTPEAYGGTCAPKPADQTSPCEYSKEPCPACGHTPTFVKCAETVDELTEHGQAQRMTYPVRSATPGERCTLSPSRDDDWVAAESHRNCPTRAECKIVEVSTTKCDPATRAGMYNRTTWRSENPHGRPSDDTNCGGRDPTDVLDRNCADIERAFRGRGYEDCSYARDLLDLGLHDLEYEGDSLGLAKSVTCCGKHYHENDPRNPLQCATGWR